jgi:hypothetical protein
MAFDPNTAALESATGNKFDPTTAQFDPQSAAIEDEVTKEQVSRFDYIANQAKLGLIDTPVLAEALIDTFVIDPFKSLAKITLDVGPGAPGGIGERFSRNIQRLQRSAAGVVGAETGQKAPDVLTGIVGSAARAVSDPLGYVGAPLKATGVAGRAAGLGTAGATAEVGGVVGESAEKGLFGTDTGVGRAVGSITAVIKGAPIAAAVQEGVAASGNVTKQVYSKYKTFKEDPDGANQAYATGAAKRLLNIIAKEQPGEKLDDVVTEFNRISNIINKEDLPLMVAMADNPAVRQQVARLAKTNPDFRSRVNQELEKLAINIDNRADLLFGKRYAPIQGFETVSVKNAIKVRENIDNQIVKLGDKLDTGVDEVAIGKAVSNLVDARLKAATTEMKPVYEGILADAAKANARMPAQSVEGIYNYIVANNVRDIFGRGTAVDAQIKRVWGPKDNVFEDVPFQEVESLKRKINQLQRGSLTRDEARKLEQLESVLNESRKTIPGDFNQRLIDADLAYYEKVGVPFSAQGIKDIDAKKYAEQVAPVIVKNSSSLNQFISAVGREAATPIARNAILAEAYEKSVKDGVINPAALRRFISQKEGVLNQLPSVKAELDTAVVDQGILALERKRINDAVKLAEGRIANNFVGSVKDSSGAAVPNYRELSSRLFSDTNFFNKIKKDISDLDPASAKAVRNSIRAELVDLARSNPGGSLEFMLSPRNAKVYNEVFGPGYVSAVKDIFKLSDAVNKADISRLSAVIERSELDALAKVVPGLDIPFVTSTLRDRIASVPQKVVRLATRVNTAQLGDATDKAISELLLDPQGVKALQKTAKEIDFNISNPISAKKYVDRLKSLMPQYFYVGSKEATVQEAELPPQPAEESMGFGGTGGFVEE